MGLLFLLSGCVVGSGTAEVAVKNAGYANIEVQGLAPFSCGDDDLTGRHFRALAPNGQPVEGVVCCGILKSCTLRF